ncbi:M1 family metallopeptidase, partial [Bacteroidota bacterium]
PEADYKMNITLDDKTQKLFGEETITYYNNSPDELNYLWVQLDQNMMAYNSLTKKTSGFKIPTRDVDGKDVHYFTPDILKSLGPQEYDGGFKIEYVKDKYSNDLEYTINYTMMRIELPVSLKPNTSVSFSIKWWYNINDRFKEGGGRSGMEYFAEDGNYLYIIAQFFPRMAVYDEIEGWQNKQFIGSGEFTLPFGDYEVNITVPSDHILGATGVLQNPFDVLTKTQIKNLEKAKDSKLPVVIVSEEEAIKKEEKFSETNSTWSFKAKNVRDFAFATSRKFVWDAMGVNSGDKTVMAMSFYPKEGNPLWGEYSTKLVAHTLKTYSEMTFDYPYPVAISVHSNQIGMEYPMICFNGGRPFADGSYDDAIKYQMFGVIIHEVGHNYFPMIVNSDERQWGWMDEGLNTFLQGIAQYQWEDNYPNWGGQPKSIVSYMKGDRKNMVPIMTNSESVINLSANAYHKTAVGMHILRETIMGRELFDYAFKQYSQRWMFKHPSPEDFFRTMEDASAVDLDWFWRGWFYTTDNVDISLDKVNYFIIENQETLLNHYYEISFRSVGGMLMPLIIEFEYEDGSKEIKKIPVEIWRRNNNLVTKVFKMEKKVRKITLDPKLETADVDLLNNTWEAEN